MKMQVNVKDFGVVNTDTSHLAASYQNESDSPFHCCYTSDALLATDDKGIPMKAHLARNDEWYFVICDVGCGHSHPDPV